MLKVKDDYNLENLNQYGFVQDSTFWFSKTLFECEDKISIAVSTEDRRVQISWSSPSSSCGYLEPELDCLYDLIQAGIIEKVPKDNLLKEIHQDVWELLDQDSVLCVLTNDSVYRANGISYNPMGAGIAGEAKRRNPEFPQQVAKAIIEKYRECDIDEQTGALLYRFSTKNDIGDWYSDLDLIAESLKDLKEYCEHNEDKKIYLPRPGCGIGGLNWGTQVRPLVEKYLGNFENIYIVSK